MSLVEVKKTDYDFHTVFIPYVDFHIVFCGRLGNQKLQGKLNGPHRRKLYHQHLQVTSTAHSDISVVSSEQETFHLVRLEYDDDLQ